MGFFLLILFASLMITCIEKQTEDSHQCAFVREKEICICHLIQLVGHVVYDETISLILFLSSTTLLFCHIQETLVIAAVTGTMGIGTCYPCSKYLLLVLNLFFWLSGAALIILGLLFLLRPEVQSVIHLFNFTALPLSSIELTAFAVILLGIIIFLIGLFGLCGAIRESRTCLILYIVLVTSILLAELALFTYIAVHHEQWQIRIKQRLVSQTKKYNHMNPSQYERAIDYVQSKYHCCGINSAYDYSESLVPMSCCSATNTSSLSSSITSCTAHQVASSNTSGCFRKLTDETIYWGKFFILVELSLCLLSLLGVFLAICVCQNVMLYDGYIRPPYRV